MARTATTGASVTIAKAQHPCGCCSRVAQRRPPPQIVVIRRWCTCRSRRHTILVVVVGQPTSASTKFTPPPSLIERSGSLVPVGVHQAGKPAGGVVARAAAARRGEAGAGQRGPGKQRRGCWGGTWHGLERCGGGRCAAHGRRGWRHIRCRETEELMAGGRRRGPVCNFPKV
jgi:hypothetical protein